MKSVNKKRDKKGWDKCKHILDGICCKDLDSGRTWICSKGFPKLKGTYNKCNGLSGIKIKICKYFTEV